MHKRIQPIIAKEVISLNWKISKEKSAHENLSELLEILAEKIEKIQEGKLPVKKHIAEKKIVLTALKETQQNLPTITLFRSLLQKKNAKEKSLALSKKTPEALIREILKLKENEPKLRKQSSDYDVAWLEIEGDYFLKMSLYETELNRRKA